MSECLQFSWEDDILYKQQSNRLKLIIVCTDQALISENIDIFIPVGSEDSHMLDTVQFEAMTCTNFESKFIIEKKDGSFLLSPNGGSIIMEKGEKISLLFDNIEPSVGDKEKAMTFVRITSSYVKKGIQYLPLFKQPPLARIIDFEAERSVIGYGDMASLSFKASNVSRCEIQPYHIELGLLGMAEIPIYQDTKFFLIGYVEDKPTLVQTVDVKLCAEQGLKSFLVDGEEESIVDYNKDVNFSANLIGTDHGYLDRGIGRVLNGEFSWKPNTTGDICQISYLDKKGIKYELKSALVMVGRNEVVEIYMVYIVKDALSGNYQLFWTVSNAEKYIVTVWNGATATSKELPGADYKMDLPNFHPSTMKVDFECIGKYDQKIQRFNVKEMVV